MNRRELLRLSALGVFPGGVGVSLASADEPAKAKSPDEMIHAYLVAEVKRIQTRFMDGAKSKEEWEKARPRLKREFLEMLGLDPLPEKTPLKATVTGTIERSGVTIEKVHFQSRPGLYVTGNLYLPKASGGREPPVEKQTGGSRPPLAKHPAILYVCGHSNRGRDGNKVAFQDHGLWFASNGYVCLVIDTLQLGEVAGKHHGTYNLERWWWHDRGYTPAGVECWNGIRAIDFLCSLPYVDEKKIGVTGISGGGATTCWIAAADDRVKVAVPVSGMSDLECYVTDKVINGHCDCMFPVNTYQWELTTILALFAPKPMLFSNSDNDPIFPMTGNRRIAERMRACYKVLGAEGKFDDYVSKGGHDYRPDLRVAIFSFFQKHLAGSDAKVTDADFPKIECKDLRVFPDDKDLPKDSINATVDETFVPLAKTKLPFDPRGFEAWRENTLKQLREKCFRALPEKVPGPQVVGTRSRYDEDWSTEPGVVFPGGMVRRGNRDAAPEQILFVLNPEENPKPLAAEWVKQYPKTHMIDFVQPRGGGAFRWSRKNPPNNVERSLVLLGQTVDSGRLRDVAAALERWPDLRKAAKVVRVVGTAEAGILAVYAALLLPCGITEVVINDPPVSHREGPHFLNVLRVCDIPEALGLLAPNVTLTLVGKNARDKAFDRTEALYKAAGVGEKFRREA